MNPKKLAIRPTSLIQRWVIKITNGFLTLGNLEEEDCISSLGSCFTVLDGISFCSFHFGIQNLATFCLEAYLLLLVKPVINDDQASLSALWQL